MSERKAFNFYKSYFDVYVMLGDKQKVEFMDALLNKQFNGIDPESLSPMANFAYISQKNNIDQQVKGWEDKTGCKLGSSDPTEPPTEPPSVQEKEKEKEKEQEKGEYIPAFEEFYDYAIEKKKNVNKESVKLKYDSWVENGWKDGNDKKIKNWKSKLLNTLQYLKEDEKNQQSDKFGEDRFKIHRFK